MAATCTHYAVLGVPEKCSNSDIKQAFRKLAKIHHPDKASEFNSSASNASFQEILAAFTVLRDPASRKKYDSTLQCHQRASACDNADSWQPTPQSTPLPRGSRHSTTFLQATTSVSARLQSTTKPPPSVQRGGTPAHPTPFSAQAAKARCCQYRVHHREYSTSGTPSFPSPAFGGRSLRYTFSPKTASVQKPRSSCTSKGPRLPRRAVQPGGTTGGACENVWPKATTTTAQTDTVRPPSPPTTTATANLAPSQPQRGVAASPSNKVVLPGTSSPQVFVVLKGFTLDATKSSSGASTGKSSTRTSSGSSATVKEASREGSQLHESVVRAVSVLTVAASAKSAEDSAWAYFRDSVLGFSNSASRQTLEPSLRSLLEQRSASGGEPDNNAIGAEAQSMAPRRTSCVETKKRGLYRYVLDENTYKESVLQSLAPDENLSPSHQHDPERSPYSAADAPPPSLTMLRVWVEQVQVGERLLPSPAGTGTASGCGGCRQHRSTIEHKRLSETKHVATSSPGKRRHSHIASKACCNAATITSPLKCRVPLHETQ